MDKHFSIDAYDYHLDDELIATKPLAVRDKCRLLIIDRKNKTITDGFFDNIKKYLTNKHQLVINNSKVLKARVYAHKETGAKIEFLFLNPSADKKTCTCMAKPTKKCRVGDTFHLGEYVLKIISKNDNGTIDITVNHTDKTVYDFLEKYGQLPLPPYMNRDAQGSDDTDYQTVYAKHNGSVAAPTAGLHFTDELLADIKSNGTCVSPITLHVGAGTFKPVSTTDIRDHHMHTESVSCDPRIRSSIISGNYINIAVGTTSCRTMESIDAVCNETNLFIYPGYSFKYTDGLITNFHLPKSSLLMLVCAFGGYELMMEAYRYAVQERYRFYSYGDAMLII
ncbi:tRNA preQ1(34) S-adenosylmethionine ribosyltransferase-isomerase QueA [Chlamydiia bacterium]|nr:tRNA preQ1(34) S-adenosylmethionine ribosyltransferase-isomerase QueA [Chlamydiia bacterium]